LIEATATPAAPRLAVRPIHLVTTEGGGRCRCSETVHGVPVPAPIRRRRDDSQRGKVTSASQPWRRTASLVRRRGLHLLHRAFAALARVDRSGRPAGDVSRASYPIRKSHNFHVLFWNFGPPPGTVSGMASLMSWLTAAGTRFADWSSYLCHVISIKYE
jgi:hypothetical protein